MYLLEKEWLMACSVVSNHQKRKCLFINLKVVSYKQPVSDLYNWIFTVFHRLRYTPYFRVWCHPIGSDTAAASDKTCSVTTFHMVFYLGLYMNHSVFCRNKVFCQAKHLSFISTSKTIKNISKLLIKASFILYKLLLITI